MEFLSKNCLLSGINYGIIDLNVVDVIRDDPFIKRYRRKS